MRRFVLLLALAAAVAAAAGIGYRAGVSRRSETAASAAKPLYHCPMHPEVTADEPGKCPICGMDLVRVDAAPPPAGSAERAEHAPGPTDRSWLELNPEKLRVLGVRSELVRAGSIDKPLRTVGRIAVDERRLHHVHTKFDGYVEHLHVDFTGKFVQKGEPLLSIYSPDLVATQQEYLLAHRSLAAMRSGTATVAEGGAGLLAAARQRLLFWDIQTEDIERLERTGEVMRTLDLHSDISGYVVAKTAFHGMRVTPADTLFDIADLSQLWVLADVYESDLPAVRLGMPAELRLPFAPGRSWRGSVTYVAPTVEEKTRTVKVRVEVANPGGLLKPDMFADVLLESRLGEGLLVPEGALIRAGERTLVFVDHGEGRLEPREVRAGVRLGGEYQILSGLQAGERVVTAANFLLDSESSLRAALDALAPGQQPTPAASVPQPAGHQH